MYSKTEIILTSNQLCFRKLDNRKNAKCLTFIILLFIIKTFLPLRNFLPL